MTAEQCEEVRHWRETAFRDWQPGASKPMRRVIVINTTFRLAPWADVLYACDAPWWKVYRSEVLQVFQGQLWTQDERAHREYGIRLIESTAAPGLSRRQGLIHQGKEGGYQSINLAFVAGARRIVLLGFDMRGGHWHGNHPEGLSNAMPYMFELWLQHYTRLAADLRDEGVEVINCTPDSALKDFPARDLAEELL
jgi:hypothetical protein